MKKKLVLLGAGKLSKIIVEAYLKGFLSDYQLCGIYSRKAESASALVEEIRKVNECHTLRSLEELLDLNPDFVVEAASVEMVREWIYPILQQGVSFITLSIGALADSDFYRKIEDTARESGAKVYVVSGAIGGLDVLRTVTLMDGGHPKVTFRTEKGPRSLRNTPVYREELTSQEKEIFNGNAKEAIAMFPTKVNVAVAAALASAGPENTEVSIHSVPQFVGDDHRITIENDSIKAVVDVYSKNADIAAWSVINTLRNIAGPIVF